MNSSCQILLVELVRSCFLLLPTTEPVLDQAHEADCSAQLNGVKTEVERQIRVLWRNVVSAGRGSHSAAQRRVRAGGGPRGTEQRCVESLVLLRNRHAPDDRQVIPDIWPGNPRAVVFEFLANVRAIKVILLDVAVLRALGAERDPLLKLHRALRQGLGFVTVGEAPFIAARGSHPQGAAKIAVRIWFRTFMRPEHIAA